MAGGNALDNPAWHALAGPLASFAEGGERARRFSPDVAPFAAVPDEAGPESWQALRDLVGPGGVAALFRAPLAVPDGWQIVMRWPCWQMSCARLVAGPPLAGFAPLRADDRDAMLVLTAATRPGPFLERTHELGAFLGVRDGARLIAMAGERLRVEGATEISAVCTDPAYRQRGLAAGLVALLVARIHDRHETPFLHVEEGNAGAMRVYEALGFIRRARIEALALRAPD